MCGFGQQSPSRQTKPSPKGHLKGRASLMKRIRRGFPGANCSTSTARIRLAASAYRNPDRTFPTSPDDAADLVFAELETAPFSREDMNVERLLSTAINLSSEKTGAALVARTVAGLGVSYAWDEQVFRLSPEARASARDWIVANLGEDSHDGRVKFLMHQMKAPAGFVYDMARDMAGTEQGERLLLAALDLLGDGRQHQYQAMQAIEARVVAHEPAGASTYYRVPSAAPELRQRLFEKAREGSKVASGLLSSIDEWRDELGRPQNELRHPDLASGSAWPILEAPNSA